MNNIYVDELPKKCKDCPFGYVGYAYDFDEVRFCKLHKDHCMHWIALYNDKFNDCPLKSLKDALAEERKKVVQEIKDEIVKLKKSAPKHNIGYDCDDVLLSYLEISEILDQIERGE